MRYETMKKLMMILACAALAAPALRAGLPVGASDILMVSPYARGAALAEAMVADDSPYSLYYNPAGIAGQKKSAIGAGFDTLLGQSIMRASLLYCLPLSKAGVLGVSLLYNSSGLIPLTKYDSLSGNVVQDGSYSASDIVLRAGFARFLVKGIAAGASLKMLYSGIEEVKSGLGVCGDAGIQFTSLIPNSYLGLAVRNLGVGPKLGLQAVPLPLTADAGFQMAVLTGRNKSPHFLAVYAQGSYLVQEGLLRGAAGVEYVLMKMYFFRVGYGLDANSLYNLTCGLGLRYRMKSGAAPRFDLSLVPDARIGHKLSFSMYTTL